MRPEDVTAHFTKVRVALDWAKTVATSLVTVLTTAAVALTTLAHTLAEEWPLGARWALLVVAAIGGAVQVLRRVTPVPPAERGMLPPSP